jgi:hypothetical protein
VELSFASLFVAKKAFLCTETDFKQDFAINEMYFKLCWSSEIKHIQGKYSYCYRFYFCL